MNKSDAGGTPPAVTLPEPSLDALRQQGRDSTPETHFRIHDEAGNRIIVTRLLRVLTGKRLVGEALWQGLQVLAKLFIAPHAQRHWERERQGIALLQAAGLPTPLLRHAGTAAGGVYLLLTEFLPGSETLEERWTAVKEASPGSPAALSVLRPAFALLGRLHAAGLIQTDAHLGNFLVHGDQLMLIDGDGIVRVDNGQSVAASSMRDNLALLVAQLPPAWDACLDDLVAAYESEQARWHPARADLLQAIDRARDRRRDHFLEKALRDCSQFAVNTTARRFSAVLRTEQDRLAGLLADPDRAIAAGQLLKGGNTCTVARAESEGQPLVIKRYNLKNRRHALSRLWRPSRAWHSWLAGHRLAFYGIATPAPLALLEERVGPLRRRAYLITEFYPGENLLERLLPDQPPEASEAKAILDLFRMLVRLRISHGDTKATNFIWHNERIALIDLDAMQQHPRASVFARHWRRDRQRFLRNWPESSALYRWLDAHLPAAP